MTNQQLHEGNHGGQNSFKPSSILLEGFTDKGQGIITLKEEYKQLLAELPPIQRDLIAFMKENNDEMKAFLELDPLEQVSNLSVAIIQEACELRDESKWKWWKREFNHNRYNFIIELSDIIHFNLQQFIVLIDWAANNKILNHIALRESKYYRDFSNIDNEIPFLFKEFTAMPLKEKIDLHKINLKRRFQYGDISFTSNLIMDLELDIIKTIAKMQNDAYNDSWIDYLESVYKLFSIIKCIFLEVFNAASYHDISNKELIDTYKKKVEENKQRQINLY